MNTITNRIWGWRHIAYLRFLIYFNRTLKARGQNAYCAKQDVRSLIIQLRYEFRDSGKICRRLEELAEDVVNLKL